MADNITDQQTSDSGSFPPVEKVSAGDLSNPPKSPLQGPHARQWQRALQLIRNKNRAAQSNNGKRVPLA